MLLAFILGWGWFGSISRELPANGTLQPCPSTAGSNSEVQNCRPKAVLFLEPEQEGFIRVGMKAHILPDGVSGERYGFLLGKVNQARIVYSEGRPWLAVDIALETDKITPSGLRWSSSQGPRFAFSTSIPVTGSIIVPHVRPLDLLLPSVSRGGA